MSFIEGICSAAFKRSLLCCYIVAERMSERADDDVRGEQQQRRAARQLKQRGEAFTAMATVAERRSLPSPEIMLGQPWSSWVDAVKLYGSDGTELEESLKECGKNREAMRLCRDDMPIFGQCPAQDDFYLVMCSLCSQVVKPQAFQAHYERRHSSSSKPPSSYAASAAFANSRNKSSLGGGVGVGAVGGSTLARPSSANSSTPTKIFKSTKEKLPHWKPHFPYRVPQEESPTPAVKGEKVHLKVEPSPKLPHVPASSSTSSSSSSNTVSTSPLKSGLNFPSIPKAPQLAPGQIPNGKGHLSSQDKKQDSSSASSRRPLYKRLEREFNPDIHCGVMDMTARKPCTRSLTCKTHSISQRRAVLGRRQRFDTLLAEHKSKARDKELQFRLDPSHPAPPLRDPHPPPSRLSQDLHTVSHGNGTADATKPLPLSKPKPHNSGLPRLNSSNSHSGGDPAMAHDQTHHSHSAPVGTETSRLSSDEGENEEREEATEKLDCHYSGYHPRPAAYCTFGSRLYGRGCYAFDRRWDQVRCTLTTMLDKHVNSQMWKKIPLALENSATTLTASHRTSTNSHSSSSCSISAGFLSLSSPPPYDSKPVLSYGTTLNARSSPQASATEQPAYSGASRQVSASSPQMPSAHSSSLPSLGSNRPLKSRSVTKSFKAREPSFSLSNSIVRGSTNSSVSVSGCASGSLSSGKKRKNSSLFTTHSTYTSESSSSSSFKKNCGINSSSLGSAYHTSLASTPSSSSSSTTLSSSHSGVYCVGVNCTPGRANSLSLKQESTGRGPPSGSPAESIKRMSVVMNSSDSTLSLGPFVHQSSDHHADARLEAKRRKCSPGSSSLNSTASGAGGGGGQGPGRPKISKSPSINNIHSKHARSIPGPPGLPNNSLIHQPKARP
ncbi:ataxin-7-like isoform X1 [Sinocyclocheilus rhinocerous]|uniref:ataxin-7-like isoform X1 n=2 Tax=Sinocyclocheilus rhinocerous TaxID=307959 RepID=UPI0007BA9B65|nr:PREDICTED: ataxin-7-like isoform X1 [Sinocyclocheilus rhinocerous]